MPMIPVVGQHVGPYEILGRLGHGGMGLVFSAWDVRLQREVAIKLLREELLTGETRERFLREARAASGLNHPNICTVFDIGEQAGEPYLVMELLKGQTVRRRIATGLISVDEMLRVGRETASALVAAHARGVVHRDLKPANLFLVDVPGALPQIKVLDFGLAKVERGDSLRLRDDLTGTDATIGTVAYMSPEQARGEALDARSDLFSLGVVLYEMATGRVPFRGATTALVFVQLLSQPTVSIRDLNHNVPRELERIVHRLLAKDRSERFQSAEDVLDAFHRLKPKGGRAERHGGARRGPLSRWRTLFGKQQPASANVPASARWQPAAAARREKGEGPSSRANDVNEGLRPDDLLRPPDARRRTEVLRPVKRTRPLERIAQPGMAEAWWLEAQASSSRPRPTLVQAAGPAVTRRSSADARHAESLPHLTDKTTQPGEATSESVGRQTLLQMRSPPTAGPCEEPMPVRSAAGEADAPARDADAPVALTALASEWLESAPPPPFIVAGWWLEAAVVLAIAAALIWTAVPLLR